jgi:hypothetical protein
VVRHKQQSQVTLRSLGTRHHESVLAVCGGVIGSPCLGVCTHCDPIMRAIRSLTRHHESGRKGWGPDSPSNVGSVRERPVPLQATAAAPCVLTGSSNGDVEAATEVAADVSASCGASARPGIGPSGGGELTASPTSKWVQ